MSSILVTGANGGLGLSVTHRMIEDGHHVLGITGKAGAGALVESKDLELFQVDLSDEKSASDFVSKTMSKIPELNAAILLVGGFAMGKLTDTTKADLDRMINLNFYTAYHIVRPLLKLFSSRKEGGRFVLIGSRPGLEPASGNDFFAYSLSKAMIFKLAEFINAVGKDNNVDAVVIVPSTINTEANRKAMPGADFDKWVTPEIIASTISFYLSPEGKMIKEGIVKVYNRS